MQAELLAIVVAALLVVLGEKRKTNKQQTYAE